MLIGGSKSSCIKKGQIALCRLSSRFVQFVTFALDSAISEKPYE